MRMDHKDLPEHLQPLMGGLAEDVSASEREELAAAMDLGGIGENHDFRPITLTTIHQVVYVIAFILMRI